MDCFRRRRRAHKPNAKSALDRIKLRAQNAALELEHEQGGGPGSSAQDTVPSSSSSSSSLLAPTSPSLSPTSPSPTATLTPTSPPLSPRRSGIHRHTLADVSVQFIGASGLPRMDVLGTADPYFVATIDGKIKFTSAVQPNTLNPVWNELWHVKNVPTDGKLKVTVYDKDDGTLTDDYIGVCEFDLEEGTKEVRVEGSRKQSRGTFWAKVTRRPPSSTSLPPYTFDGPISYSLHSSPTIGMLTRLDDNGKRLYSTWKVHIKGVSTFLGGAPLQSWNKAYPAAQHIFGTGPGAWAVRATIQTGHRLLYARSTCNAFGTLEGAKDVRGLLEGGRRAPHRVKPAVYTYVVCADDETLRFSETGAAFFVDFASKHALHANCAEAVRYAGEFHPRPVGPRGWGVFDEDEDEGDGVGRVGVEAGGVQEGPRRHERRRSTLSDADVEWELVVDNNSGTYAPSAALLPQVRELIAANFPGFGVVALDREDGELVRSREACRAYAVRWRAEARKELEPNRQLEGEVTLSERARVEVGERTVGGEGITLDN